METCWASWRKVSRGMWWRESLSFVRFRWHFKGLCSTSSLSLGMFFPKEGCSTVIKWVKYHNKLIKPLWFPQLLSTSTSQRSNYCPLSRRRGLSVHVLCLENIHKHGKEAKPTTRTLEYNSVICAIKWMTLSVTMSTWLPLIDSTRVIYITLNKPLDLLFSPQFPVWVLELALSVFSKYQSLFWTFYSFYDIPC